MAWLKRLFYAPMLIKLHWDHSVLVERVQRYQLELHAACEMETLTRIPNKPGIQAARDRLEKTLEQLADHKQRMEKLWFKS